MRAFYKKNDASLCLVHVMRHFLNYKKEASLRETTYK